MILIVTENILHSVILVSVILSQTLKYVCVCGGGVPSLMMDYLLGLVTERLGVPEFDTHPFH